QPFRTTRDNNPTQRSTAMAKFPTLIIFAMLLAILHRVSAATKEPEICGPLTHPLLDCSESFICEKDWPSETGNYGSIDPGTKIITRNEPLRRIWPHDLGINSTANTNEIHQRRSALSFPAHSGSVFPEQC
ncbi:hypothetical protein CLAIMM_00480, partial [Cladophialophora immunda]